MTATSPRGSRRERVVRRREDAFRGRLAARIERALAAIGHDFAIEELARIEDADALLQLVLELLAEQLAGFAARTEQPEVELLYRSIIDLHQAQNELHAFRTDQRTAALANVQDGLSRLRGVLAVRDILVRATEESCRSCAFDRALVFRIEGSRVIAQGAYVRDSPDGSAGLLDAAVQAPLELSPALLENEVLRRRVPRILEADDGSRLRRLLAPVLGAHAYVVAPIAPEGRVIGIIAADTALSGRRLDALDRDTLWTFAEGLGYALERSVLLERLQVHRAAMGHLLAAGVKSLDDLCEPQIELGHDADAADASAAGVVGVSGRAAESLLSRRELEVMRLLAGGYTNGAIAKRLVISEDTVKSHVRRILRKLQAANRAEAVSRFMGLTYER